MFDDIVKKLNINADEFEDSDGDGCRIYDIPTSNIYSRIYTTLDKNYKEDLDRANITAESSTNFYLDEDGTVIQLNADLENDIYKLIIKERAKG